MPSVLITGANHGLGLEFARQYAVEGWQVYAGCRDLGSASKLRRLANTSENKIRIMALDVTDPASIKAAAARLNGQAIDLLLNNAGVMGPQGQTIGKHRLQGVGEGARRQHHRPDAGFRGVC